MSFFLKRIIRSGSSFHTDAVRLDLKGLLGFRRGYQRAAHDDGRADVQMRNLREVIQRVVVHHLKGGKAGAVCLSRYFSLSLKMSFTVIKSMILSPYFVIMPDPAGFVMLRRLPV